MPENKEAFFSPLSNPLWISCSSFPSRPGRPPLLLQRPKGGLPIQREEDVHPPFRPGKYNCFPREIRINSFVLFTVLSGRLPLPVVHRSGSHRRPGRGRVLHGPLVDGGANIRVSKMKFPSRFLNRLKENIRQMFYASVKIRLTSGRNINIYLSVLRTSSLHSYVSHRNRELRAKRDVNR